MKHHIIQLQNVIKRYQSGDSMVFALNGINLIIESGQFIMVMGPSGSGKTTLLNIMAGLAKTTEGQVIIDNKLLQRLSDNDKAELRRSTLGFIFQFYNLHEGLTAQENIELPMMIAHQIPKNERKLRSKELLELVDLENRANNQPFELSGGEQQRVGIARALANDPPIILADEPTGDLDSQKAREILNLLIELNEKLKKTLVVVSHDPSMLKPGMRLLKMEDGKIIDDILVTTKIIEELHSQNEDLMDTALAKEAIKSN